ncbi:MAG: zinc ABC transporter substrate-binding protein [Chthoniobacterales bacterium]|nr:zinc ABC transporter substrate-binding protein [Chthoniobacterales bacterium]
MCGAWLLNGFPALLQGGNPLKGGCLDRIASVSGRGDGRSGRSWKSARSLCAIFLLGFFPTGAQSLEILASFYPMYVSALNVVGDTPGVKVTCLTEPFVGCLHDYALTAGDMKKLAGADILVTNGAGMETFVDKAVKQSPVLRIIEAGKGIPQISGDNPHVWVGLSGAIQQVKNIARELEAADPARAEHYRKNADAYVKKLEALRADMHAALDGVKNRDIITFHEAFPYFAQEFGLNIVGVIEREPGSESTAREMAETIDLVRQRKVPALFAEPQYPAKSARVIERETGVVVSLLDPVVTGPREPSAARDAYLVAMRKNLDVLRKALSE